MKRAVLVGALIAAVSVVLAVRVPAGPKTVEFKKALLRVETNATDGDAGLQIDLDHEPWRSITIARPDGETILSVTATGVLRDYGLTELFSESSEPPFDTFPFEEFRKLFPEGRYTFEGETIDGTAMRSRVTLTHRIPAGPEITSPEEDSTVEAADVVVAWEPVPEPAGIDVVAYQVLVTREAAPQRVFSAQVSEKTTSLTTPEEFLESGVEYKVEVLAIERGGNQTLTELTFTVA